jgi:hypothetical protein
MSEPKKTHVLVPEPTITVRYLADYMAASERTKRAIVSKCKYRPIAPMVQHKEARITIASAFRKGTATPQYLKERADSVRAKLATDDFDALTNEANADYLAHFSKVVAEVELPKAEILPGKSFPPLNIHGVKIVFTPGLLLRRITKTNKLRRGAIMFRYAKGKPLDPKAGCFQSAAMFGLLGEHADEEGSQPEKSLCLTLDGVTGKLHPAPGTAISDFANMKAACQTIAERWPNIPQPPKAIF